MAQGDVTRIASNIGALNALNSLVNINKQLALHQGRISTGKRINSAADDPAGLTIATKMLARSEGLKTALSNISDASNLLSVAESGLSKMNDILIQMRSKAQQASSETLGGTERIAIQTQLSSYAEQIDNIVNETKWNGETLLTGTVTKQFQTGAESGDVTRWALAQNHAPGVGGLGLSVSTANVLTTGIAIKGDTFGDSAGFPAPDGVAAFTGQSELKTGSYTLTNLAMASSNTVGSSSFVSGAAVMTGITGTALTTGTMATQAELKSGVYNIDFSDFDSVGGTIDFAVTDSSGNQLYSIDNFEIPAGGKLELNTVADGSGLNLGISLNIDTSVMTTGDSGAVTVEYIASNHIKYNLKDGSGTVQSVDQDGVAGGTTGLVGYANMNAGLKTGRGIEIVAADLAGISGSALGDYLTFDYTKKGNYEVNVTTVAKAQDYMHKVDLAIDTVNESMNSLGSLMARLQFKEDQVSTAQVNVEASYSRIMNANMAEEQVNASKYTILQQTATAMLAQANTAPQNLLTLFR